MLPISTTSMPVASVVTMMKIISLTSVAAGLLVEEAHRTLTSDPRASGPNISVERSPHLVGGDARAPAPSATP